jgi:hypothetical protein
VPAPPRQTQRQLTEPRREATLAALAGCLLVSGLLASGLLVSCGPSAQQRREAQARAEQLQRALAQLQRCRRDQPRVSQLGQEVTRHSNQIRALNAERYVPSPRPEPPDPLLASRFTQEDRELDELRYRERLSAWEALEQQRYGRWLSDQQGQRDRLRKLLESDATKLKQIAPELFTSSGQPLLKPDALARATRCSPADFGLQESEAAGSSSSASAS